MEDFFNALVHCLGQINPLYAVLAVAVWVLFGEKIKGLLARLPFKLPDLKRPEPEPDAPSEPTDPLDDWLEEHPLLDRLWQRLKLKFTETVQDDVDEDELYVKLLKAIRETK